MKDNIILLLALAAIPLFMLSVAYLFSAANAARRGPLPPGRRLKARLAFGCAAFILAAHRAAMTWMLLSMDFNDRNVQEGFGMAWWFIDPLAGFPVILGTLPFTDKMPVPQFITGVYIPLAILLYAGIIYLLWLAGRRALRAAPEDGAAA